MFDRLHQEPELTNFAYALMRSRLARAHAAGRLRLDEALAFRTLQATSFGLMSLFVQGLEARDIAAVCQLTLEALLTQLVGGATSEVSDRQLKGKT